MVLCERATNPILCGLSRRVRLDTCGGKNKTVRAVWRELVPDQEMSGPSGAEFCRARDLRVGQFYAWRRRLREGAEGGFVEVAAVAAQPGGELSHQSRSLQAKRPPQQNLWVAEAAETGKDAASPRQIG